MKLGVEDDCERSQGLVPVCVSAVGTRAEKVEVRILSGCHMHINDMRCQMILILSIDSRSSSSQEEVGGNKGYLPLLCNCALHHTSACIVNGILFRI